MVFSQEFQAGGFHNRMIQQMPSFPLNRYAFNLSCFVIVFLVELQIDTDVSGMVLFENKMKLNGNGEKKEFFHFFVLFRGFSRFGKWRN